MLMLLCVSFCGSATVPLHLCEGALGCHQTPRPQLFYHLWQRQPRVPQWIRSDLWSWQRLIAHRDRLAHVLQ